MRRVYYVIETEFGESESSELSTLQEAKKELKRCLQFYKDNMSDGNPPCELIIVKYTEIDGKVFAKEVR